MNLHVQPDFDVVDESDDWLVVNKPAPLIVHPANRQSEPTLLDGVRQLLAFERENGRHPAIVNRLDRETSGLVVVAKHREAARALGLLFENRQVDKEYLAIVAGSPRDEQWTVDAPILRAGELGPSEIWVRQIVHPRGKSCRTRFAVLQRFRNRGREFSLIRCVPETGRMHQIRVHLRHSGHPILGDKIYSGSGEEYLQWMLDGWSEALQERLLFFRHALHASRLEIPWENEEKVWQAPLPADMEIILQGSTPDRHPDVVIWNRDE